MPLEIGRMCTLPEAVEIGRRRVGGWKRVHLAGAAEVSAKGYLHAAGDEPRWRSFG